MALQYRPVLRSLGEYVPAVLHGWLYAIIVGFLGGVFGLVIQYLEIIDLQWWHWALLLSLALIAAQFKAFHNVREERDSLYPFHLNHENYQFIDERQSFELYEMACLWVGEQPALPMTKKAKKQFGVLGAAVESGELAVIKNDLHETVYDAYHKSVSGTVPDANPHWKVTKESALSYAKAVQQRPPFLFPKERAKI